MLKWLLSGFWCYKPKKRFEDYHWDKIFERWTFRDDEVKIIELKRRGWANVDIAEELYLSVSTIKRRTKHIVDIIASRSLDPVDNV